MTYIDIGNATLPALWVSVVVALLLLSLFCRKNKRMKEFADIVFTYYLLKYKRLNKYLLGYIMKL